MKWIAASVTFDSPDRDLAVDLVADLFYSLDLKGVAVDDPDPDPQQDWGEDAVPPPAHPGVTGYFADTPGASGKCRALEAALARLERTAGITARVTYTRMDEQDWAEAWKEFFWPQKNHRHHRGQTVLAGLSGEQQATSSWTSIRVWPSAPAPMPPPACASA
jgi:ribosomal protein L11 methyltransferase